MSIQSNRPITIALSLFALLATLCVASVANANESEDTSRYIVVLKDSVENPRSLARAQTEQRRGKLGFVYRHAIKGYSAELPKAAVEGLRNDSRVESVTRDHVLHLFSQTTPTGIDRTFATANEVLAINEEDDFLVDADVAVIDTGIDEHEDLDVFKRTDCATENEETFKCVDDVGGDYLGHGTHVAGTIGAMDNDYGVVGIAPGARLWSVRVSLSEPLKTFESSAVAGVDWVADHSDEIEVANMSFGCYESVSPACPSGLPALETAITNAVEAGVVMVAAAGNGSVDAAETHPAAHPDVIAVSALEDHDGAPGAGFDPLASFSNFGSVDVAAPGVAILSTLPGNNYGTKSGTSMAAPHVAGAAAILAANDNPDSKEDVGAIRDTIVEAGNFDWEDTSDDGVQEPLLDVSDEGAFGEGPEDPKIPLPVAVTFTAGFITAESTRLSGWLNPEGSATHYWFEYGKTTAYGSKVPLTPVSVGSGNSNIPAIQDVTGLEPDTTYHFRIVAENSYGKTLGKDKKWTTKKASVWLHNGAPLGSTASVNFHGAFGFDSGENGGVECEVSVGIDLEPGNSGTLSGLGDGAECASFGALDEVFGCQVESLDPEGATTLTGGEATLTANGLQGSFATSEGCLLGPEITFDCDGIELDPDDISLIEELSAAESQECETNIGLSSALLSLKGPPLGEFGFGAP